MMNDEYCKKCDSFWNIEDPCVCWSDKRKFNLDEIMKVIDKKMEVKNGEHK